MDAELDAMRAIANALAPLEDSERTRVLQWAASKYGANLNAHVPSAAGSATDAEPNSSFSDFADLFYAASPTSQAERALVASFWLSGESAEPFQSQALNALLKDLGFQVSNITDALSQSMREKPALIVQIKKSGNTRQARKSYKITDAGLRKVRAMIHDHRSNGESNG